MRSAFLSCLAVATAILPGVSQAQTDTENFARVAPCFVELIEDRLVPAQQAGVLRSVEVKEGDQVEVDQLLAQIEDRDARLRKKAAEAQLRAARAEADNDINVRSAEATAEVAEAEVDESRSLNQRSPGTIPATQVRREELQAHRSRLQIEVAALEQEVAHLTADVRESEVEAADYEIERRQVRAPLEGEVVKLFHQSGEWVEPGTPIARLVRMDRLRVEGFVDAEQYAPQQVANAEVSIRIFLPAGQEETLPARISYVSPLIEGGDQYRIRAEVDNRTVDDFWLLRPGLSAEMVIRLNPVGR